MTLEELIELTNFIASNNCSEINALTTFSLWLKNSPTQNPILLNELEAYLKAQLNTSQFPGEVESLLGYIFQIKGELPIAIQHYESAMAKGSLLAINNRAYMHQYGIGGPVNLEEAIHLYDLAIAKGYPLAMNNRAYMHQHAIGGPINLKEAIRLYDLAIAKGIPEAMYNRAHLHLHGIGSSKNLPKAIRLYDLAIAKGNAAAMYKRARMHQDGIGGEKNIAKAVDLLIRALTNEAWSKLYGLDALNNLIKITNHCSHPSIKAQIAIFIIYKQGISGIPMDQNLAKIHYKGSFEFIEALLDIYILQLIGAPTYFPTIEDATISFLKASINPNSLPLFKFKEIEARQALLAGNGEKALESLLSLPINYFSDSEHLLHFIMLILNCVGPDQKSVILPYLDWGTRHFSESKDLDILHRFLVLEIEGKPQKLGDETEEHKTQRYAEALVREKSLREMEIKGAVTALENHIGKLGWFNQLIWPSKDLSLAQKMLADLQTGLSPYIVYLLNRMELKEFPALKDLLIKHCYHAPSIIEKPAAAKPNFLALNVFANAPTAAASTGLSATPPLPPTGLSAVPH
jgi:TPR repeat protein